MARDLITTADVIGGEGSPYGDSVNQYGREIWADFKEEHETDGTQKSPYEEFLIVDADTYTGTGAALTVTWPGSTYTEILKVEIWSESDGEIYIIYGETTTVYQATDGATVTNGVTAIDTDGITFGTSTELNTNTTSYYYTVTVMGSTPDAGSNASPPPWIADGTACLGGAASTMANDVWDDLDTKFLGKHTINTGAHDDSEFDDIQKGEYGTFTPDGTIDQSITLDNTDLVLTSLYVNQGILAPPAVKAGTADTLRRYTTTALTGANLVTLGTGEFSLDSSALGTEDTYIQINSDTTDGDTTFTDSSGYGFQIAGIGGIAHSTDFAQAGASSIKIDTTGKYLNISAPTVNQSIVYLTGDFDCSLYLKTDGVAFDDNALLWLYGQGLALNIDGATAVVKVYQVAFGLTAQTLLITGTTQVNDNAFHQISLIKTGSTLTLKVGSNIEGTSAVDVTQGGTGTPNIGVSMIGFGHTTVGSYLVGTTLMHPTDIANSKKAYIDEFYYKLTPHIWQQGREYSFVAIGED